MAELKSKDSTSSRDRWGIILSGGNGTRLQDWVYAKRSDYLPKQYLNFIGKRSMLEHTSHRAEKLIPAEKLLTVITREHLQFEEVRRQIAPRPQECILIQPRNRDTGAGILISLMHLYKRSVDAAVAVFPSDHFIVEEDLFMRHVERAFRLAESDAARVILLGMEPHQPDPEYGYIVYGKTIEDADLEGSKTVEMFVEKPSADVAKAIIKRGALWNTLVVVATCKTLLQVMQRSMPELYHSFEPIQDAIGTPEEQSVTERTYRTLPSVNFSKGVLEMLSYDDRQNLRVLPVRGVTWDDWGTSDRLKRTLRQLEARDSSHREPARGEAKALPVS